MSKNCANPGVSIKPRVIFAFPSVITHWKSFTLHCTTPLVDPIELLSSGFGEVCEASLFIGVTKGFEGPLEGTDDPYDDFGLEPAEEAAVPGNDITNMT